MGQRATELGGNIDSYPIWYLVNLNLYMKRAPIKQYVWLKHRQISIKPLHLVAKKLPMLMFYLFNKPANVTHTHHSCSCVTMRVSRIWDEINAWRLKYTDGRDVVAYCQLRLTNLCRHPVPGQDLIPLQRLHVFAHSRDPHPAIKSWCQVPFTKSKTIFQIEMYCM